MYISGQRDSLSPYEKIARRNTIANLVKSAGGGTIRIVPLTHLHLQQKII